MSKYENKSVNVSAHDSIGMISRNLTCSKVDKKVLKSRNGVQIPMTDKSYEIYLQTAGNKTINTHYVLYDDHNGRVSVVNTINGHRLNKFPIGVTRADVFGKLAACIFKEGRLNMPDYKFLPVAVNAHGVHVGSQTESRQPANAMVKFNTPKPSTPSSETVFGEALKSLPTAEPTSEKSHTEQLENWLEISGKTQVKETKALKRGTPSKTRGGYNGHGKDWSSLEKHIPHAAKQMDSPFKVKDMQLKLLDLFPNEYKGYETTNDSFRATVSAYLNRLDRFEKVGHGKFNYIGDEIYLYKTNDRNQVVKKTDEEIAAEKAKLQSAEPTAEIKSTEQTESEESNMDKSINEKLEESSRMLIKALDRCETLTAENEALRAEIASLKSDKQVKELDNAIDRASALLG